MSMRWVPLVVATVLLVAALLIVWLVAVPVGPLACPAIYPALVIAGVVALAAASPIGYAVVIWAA
jgi:hypothetical protein